MTLLLAGDGIVMFTSRFRWRNFRLAVGTHQMLNKTINQPLKKLVVSFLFFCSFPCFSQGGEAFNGRVLFFSYQGRVINPFTTYGNRLRYYIDPSARSFTFNVGGRSYPQDGVALIKEAFDEWCPLFGGQIKFDRVDSEQDADLIVIAQAGKRERSALASGAPKLVDSGGKTFKAIFRYLVENIEINFDQWRDDAKKYMGANASDKEILDFLMRSATKHEIGHVLGLQHPDADRPNYDTLDSARSLVVVPSYDNPGTPIMYSNIFGYMRSLYNNLGDNPISISNITISHQEELAIHIMYEATQHGCFNGQSSSIANKSLSSDSYTCPSQYVMRGGVLNAIYMLF